MKISRPSHPLTRRGGTRSFLCLSHVRVPTARCVYDTSGERPLSVGGGGHTRRAPAPPCWPRRPYPIRYFLEITDGRETEYNGILARKWYDTGVLIFSQAMIRYHGMIFCKRRYDIMGRYFASGWWGWYCFMYRCDVLRAVLCMLRAGDQGL